MARRWTTRLGLGLIPLLAATPADAQPMHQHLRLIAPAAPGGGWDLTARAMQAALQEAGLVATSSVENIPGAAGTIGLARFISAERGKDDVLMLSGQIMLGAVVTHQSPVTLAEVTPIARLVGEYEAIVVPAVSPIGTLGDLVDAFRAAPEAISWAGGSAGGTDQILAWLFAEAVGVDPRRVNYIAYSGGGEALPAILGGQVTLGVNGLEGLAGHIEAGTVRVLAVSSAARIAGLDAPTFVEQGVNVEIENWRSVVAPPGITLAARQRLERTIEALAESAAWKATLDRYRWSDRYLAGTAFARFTAAEEARITGIVARLGTATSSAGGPAGGVGPYPLLVVAGLLATGLLSLGDLVRAWTRQPASDVPAAQSGGWRAIVLVSAAAAIDLLLLESAGFVLASSAMFWLTARAFDAGHPWRDAWLGVALSAGAYVLFARLLQLSLPPGILAGAL